MNNADEALEVYVILLRVQNIAHDHFARHAPFAQVSLVIMIIVKMNFQC